MMFWFFFSVGTLSYLKWLLTHLNLFLLCVYMFDVCMHFLFRDTGISGWCWIWYVAERDVNWILLPQPDVCWNTDAWHRVPLMKSSGWNMGLWAHQYSPLPIELCLQPLESRIQQLVLLMSVKSCLLLFNPCLILEKHQWLLHGRITHSWWVKG